MIFMLVIIVFVVKVRVAGMGMDTWVPSGYGDGHLRTLYIMFFCYVLDLYG